MGIDVETIFTGKRREKLGLFTRTFLNLVGLKHFSVQPNRRIKMANANQNRSQENNTNSKSKGSSNPGNFKNDPQKASEAGRKGGKARSKNQ